MCCLACLASLCTLKRDEVCYGVVQPRRQMTFTSVFQHSSQLHELFATPLQSLAFQRQQPPGCALSFGAFGTGAFSEWVGRPF